MRVLHVSEVAWGGVVSLLREFAGEQVKRGHDVALLAPPSFPALSSVTHHVWGVDRRRPASAVHALLQLRAAVLAHRPDVVHLHSAIAGILGRLPVVAATRHVPVVYQPHAWSFDLYGDKSLGDKAFGRLLLGWERSASHRTQILVANCTDEVEEGRRAGIDIPSYALGVPLDTDHFHTVDDSARGQHRVDLSVGAKRMVLCLGRLVRQKGQDQLVAAWEASPLPDTELVLVGPGDPAAIEKLAPSQWGRTIRAVGEQSDVRPWLWASDVLVLPSRYETVAVVVVEAMACGRPVVATRVNGAEMAVTDGPYPPAGAVVDAGAMEDLLAECRRRLDDHELWQQEAQAGRQRAVALFNPSAVVDLLDTAYAGALGERERVR